jgi:hypothetical protein
MTVTLIPEQLAEGTDHNSESAVVETEDTKVDVQKLAQLLGQAFVAMPLFP